MGIIFQLSKFVAYDGLVTLLVVALLVAASHGNNAK